jgi:hypothetical protein
MTRRAYGLVAGALLLAVAGCGGGDGGDEDAFCDNLEALSEQVADGDLASNDGLDDVIDRLNELREVAADGAQSDAVQEAGELIEEADADEAADTAEDLRDQLGDLAEDTCDVEDAFAAPEETTTTTTEPDDPTTTTGGGGEDPPPPGELNVVAAAVDPATVDVEPGAEENVDLCFRGLMSACDDIFFGENGQAAAPEGSNLRAYAGTCGGRISDFVNDTIRCADNIFAAADFDAAAFDDASFEDLAAACQGSDDVDGDMEACDDLFLGTGVGTVEEAYGDTCGGRIFSEVADRGPGVTCVSIFGPVAEFG